VVDARHESVYQVAIGGRVLAHLYRRGDYTWLEWQDGYWDDPRRPVLGLRFEDRPRAPIASALRLPTWFSNLLPEGRLRDWVAKDAGVNPEREMLLLERLGSDLPGAVTVVRVDHPADPRWRPDEIVQTAREKFSAQGAILRFSLAGVALKFSMLQDGDRLTLPASAQDGDWIVKLPDLNYPNLPNNEFAMMSMASLVGIEVPDLRLLHRDELPPLPKEAWPNGQEFGYAIKRFDRSGDGRIHMEDLAQVKGVYPNRKYEGSYETAAAYVYRSRDLDSYLEFVRRLFFSVAIGNSDMHLKNISIIYPDGRRPKISPAYDIVSTAPYHPDFNELSLRLGRTRLMARVNMAAFAQLAQVVGAPVGETCETIRSVASQVPDAWASVRDDLQMLPSHQVWLDNRIPQIVKEFS